VKTGPRRLRLVAGVVVLLILAFIGLVLSPSYAANWKLQRFISQLSQNPPAAAPVESIRAAIVNKAAALGLPVRSDDVHVEVSLGAVRVDVLYVVRAGVGGYTVDLHFRPAAGGN
jgi:hypothetical protein